MFGRLLFLKAFSESVASQFCFLQSSRSRAARPRSHRAAALDSRSRSMFMCNAFINKSAASALKRQPSRRTWQEASRVQEYM